MTTTELYAASHVPGQPVSLRASRCTACGATAFPSRECCAICAAPTAPVEFGRGGRLLAATAVLHPPPGSLRAPPYVVGLARFDEVGLVVLGVVTDADDPEQIDDGAVVDTVAAVLEDGSPTYVFVRPGGER